MSFRAGDYVSSAVLAVLILAIAAYVTANNPRFVSVLQHPEDAAVVLRF